MLTQGTEEDVELSGDSFKATAILTAPKVCASSEVLRPNLKTIALPAAEGTDPT